MALLFTEGFDWLSATADITRKWNYNNAFTLTASGRTGSGFTRSGNVASGENFYRSFSSSSSTLICGAAIKVAVIPGSVQLFGFRDGATHHVTVWANNAGSIVISRSGGGTSGPPAVLGTSATNVFLADTWAYVEFKVFISDTVGTAEVCVNGVSVLSLTGQDTKNTTNSTANIIVFGGGGNSSPLYSTGMTVDDVYLCDGTGSYNNDFLGDSKIITLRPNADSSPLQFTPTPGGTHYTTVDEAAYSASDYVLGTTAGHRDQFGVEDLSVTPNTIHAVVVNTVAEKTEAASRGMKQYVKSSSSESLSAAVAVSYGSAVNAQHIVERDPNGSVAWSKSAVDAMEIGVEVA